MPCAVWSCAAAAEPFCTLSVLTTCDRVLPPLSPAQIYPIPANAAVQSSPISPAGFTSVTGTYGVYMDSLLGLCGKGPTPFNHTCPLGQKVLGIDVSACVLLCFGEGMHAWEGVHARLLCWPWLCRRAA